MDESQILQWYERTLDQEPAERRAWLDAQALPEWLMTRVLRLLDTESSLGGFLEEPLAMPGPADFPRIGERVGSYELLRRIDSGGMGVVYLARRADDAYQQQVAIKLIRPLHLGMGGGFREQIIHRFERERAVLARLRHANIARILDGGSTTAGIPWLAMDYVEGMSLLDYADAHALDGPARLALFRKVCDGVQEAHRHLIVHRDLKPDNILVDSDGEPKLLDFGIAHVLDDDSLRESPLTPLTAMTPAYASPEQVRREPLTTSSDVYSLGVVLYQLLTGNLPYAIDGMTSAQAELTMDKTNVPSLREALSAAPLDALQKKLRFRQLSPDLDLIVAKAMLRDPTSRYLSAQELGADIQRFLDGEPVLAHPDAALYRFGKFVRRHRAGSLATTLALVSILGATSIALWQGQEARKAAADTKQINAFLLDVLKMSDPFDAGAEPTLGQALDNAVTDINERFAGRPDLASEIRFGIGYSMLGRYQLQAAEQQLLQALAESQEAFGNNDTRTLRVQEAIAFLRQEQGRHEEAIRGFTDVATRMELERRIDDPLYPTALANLGNLYLAREDYAEADHWLRRADAQARRMGDAFPAIDAATIISNLAQAAHGLQDLAQAEVLYRDAQQRFETLQPEGAPDLAILLNNRALLAEETGDPLTALALHRSSLAIRRQAFKADHPMVMNALVNVAQLSIDHGDPVEALHLAEEAAGIADRTYTSPVGRHATTHATLALARLANNDTEGAVTALHRAEELFAQVVGPSPLVQQYMRKVQVILCQQSRRPADSCTNVPSAAPPEP